MKQVKQRLQKILVTVTALFCVLNLSSEMALAKIADNLHVVEQNSYSLGDINLTQGDVEFTDVDLTLPGIAGMDIVIGRRYSSRLYESSADIKTINSKTWGAGFGSGWSLTFMHRAFVIKVKDDSSLNRVVIDQGSSVSTFYYDPEKRTYISKVPGQQGQVTVTRRGIVYQAVDGKKYYYQKRFYEEGHSEPSKTRYAKDHLINIRGYLISMVSDAHRNYITYKYQRYGSAVKQSWKSVDKDIAEGIGLVIGKEIYEWKKETYKNKKIVSRSGLIPYRCNAIWDSFVSAETKKPRVTLSWSGSKLKTVTYTNDNNAPSKLEYSYTRNGELEKVTVNGRKRRAYHYSRWLNLGIENSKRRIKLDKGLLVTAYNSRWGKIRYYYELSKGYADNGGIIYLNPTVTKKVVRSSSDRVTYEFIHQKKHGGAMVVDPAEVLTGRAILKELIGLGAKKYKDVKYEHMKRWYTPTHLKETGARVYYFDTVTVKTTASNGGPIEAEHYVFGAGLLRSKTQGKFKTSHRWDYDKNVKIQTTVKVEDVVKGSTLYWYDDFNNLTKKEYSSSIESGLDLRETRKYPESPFVKGVPYHLPSYILVENFKEKNSASNSRRFSYTDKGQVQSKKDSNGKTVFTYDEKGRVIETTFYAGVDKKGLKTKTRYTVDKKRFLVVEKQTNNKKATHYYHLQTGRVHKEKGFHNETTAFDYDNWGRLVSTTHPDNQVSLIKYTSFLNRERILEGPGSKTLVKNDGMGRVTVVQNLLTGKEEKTEYYYNNLVSKVYSRSIGEKKWELEQEIKYDSYLRPIKTTIPKWGSSRTEYDDKKQLVTSFDFQGRKQVKRFNNRDEVVETKQYLSESSSLDNQYYSEGFGGRELHKDAKGIEYKQDLDFNGNVRREYYPRDPRMETRIGVKKEYRYYNDKLLRSTILRNKDSGKQEKETKYVYDNELRLVEIKENGQSKEKRTYDETSLPYGIGRVSEVDSEGVRTQYNYDILGRVISEKTILPESQARVSEVKTSYTDFGAVASTTYPDGKKIKYSYTESGALKGVEYNGKPILSYSYGDDMELSKMELGKHMHINYDYTDRDELKSLRVKKKNNSTLYWQNYHYDDAGRVTKTEYKHPVKRRKTTRMYRYYPGTDEISEVSVDAGFGLPEIVDPRISQRDPQLSEDRDYVYSYDNNSNIVNQKRVVNGRDVLLVSSYSKGNELLTQQYRRGSRKERTEFDYDSEGQLEGEKSYKNRRYRKRVRKSDGRYHYVTVKKETLNRSRKYSYNYQGQLSELEETKRFGRRRTIKYSYNHNRLRVHKQLVSKRRNRTWTEDTWYVYDHAGRIIAEEKQTITWKKKKRRQKIKYIYNGNEKIAMLKTLRSGREILFFFINNAQGTPQMIVSEHGSVHGRIHMDEWGNIDSRKGRLIYDEVNFTGKKRDKDSGLYYFGQRYYDANQGRFITHDPARQYHNLYLYASNNPLSYVDPNGEWAWVVPLLFEAAKGAAISAGINATVQLVTTGEVNWDSVGQSALMGGLSAGLSFGIGEAGEALAQSGHAWGEGLAFKTAAHGISGGIQSMASGEKFSSGFLSGAIGNMTASSVGGIESNVGKIAASGFGGGVGAALGGGNFWAGFQNGAFIQGFNHMLHGEMDPHSSFYKMGNRQSAQVEKLLESHGGKILIKSGGTIFRALNKNWRVRTASLVIERILLWEKPANDY